jgi:hypothetical protein
VHRVEFVHKRARPGIQDLRDRHLIGDGEREVQVGEAIAVVHSERAHHGTRNDTLVILGEAEHSFAERIPLFRGEHGARVYPRSSERNASKRSASSATSRFTVRGSVVNGSVTTRPSSARQMPATNPSTRKVGATSPFIPMTALR